MRRLGALPVCFGAGHDVEEWVRGGCLVDDGGMPVGGAGGRFGEQMHPFERELPVADGEGRQRGGEFSGDLGAVESVAAAVGLVGDASEVAADGGERVGLFAKAGELRVFGVSAGLAGEHFLGEEGFAPAGDQGDSVELAGVDAPDAHGCQPTITGGRGSAMTLGNHPPASGFFLSHIVAIDCQNGGMRCPVDDATLLMSERSGIEIDYCPECRGVWLDRGELDKILERDAQVSARPVADARVSDSRVSDARGADSRYVDGRVSQSSYDSRSVDSRSVDPRVAKKKRRESWLGEIFEGFGD